MRIRNIAIFIVTLLLPYYIKGAATLSAQSDAVDATAHIVFETAGEKEYRTVQYALFKSETKAKSVMLQLEEAVAAQRGDKGTVQMPGTRRWRQTRCAFALQRATETSGFTPSPIWQYS